MKDALELELIHIHTCAFVWQTEMFEGKLGTSVMVGPCKRVSMGLTVRRKTAKNLAVRRKNERIEF